MRYITFICAHFGSYAICLHSAIHRAEPPCIPSCDQGFKLNWIDFDSKRMYKKKVLLRETARGIPPAELPVLGGYPSPRDLGKNLGLGYPSPGRGYSSPGQGGTPVLDTPSMTWTGVHPQPGLGYPPQSWPALGYPLPTRTGVPPRKGRGTRDQ